MSSSDEELAAFVAARLDEDERIARAASGRDGETPSEPEEWHWECCTDDQPLDVDLAIAGGEEILEHGEHYRVGLRSVQQYPTRSVGPLSHLVLSDEEVRPQDARHIARHDPARALREVAAKRKILAEHKAVIRLAELTGQELGFLGWYREWVLKNLAAAWSDHPAYRARWGHGPGVLTSGDPQPPAGTLVRDDCGTEWRHDGDGGYWLREDDPGGDPESWVKIAGNYGPVTVLEYGG